MRILEGRATILFDRDDGLSIKIEDRFSGIPIRVQLNPKETMKALSRQAYVECEITLPDADAMHLIGMKCETKTVLIEKTWDTYNPTIDLVVARCVKEGLFVDGWSLWQDGLSTQQNTRGKHKVILRRYV